MPAIQILLVAILVALIVLTLAKRRPAQEASAAAEPSTPFGPALAAAVADRLERGHMLAYRHRDYCGTGLCFVEPQYIYSEVFDGRVLTPDDLRQSGTNPANIDHLVFGSRDAFVSWLAAQSDESLAGQDLSDEWLRGNQRITRARLEGFASGRHMPGE